jgi:oxygen-dependent protoporphyrinogen oxidase
MAAAAADVRDALGLTGPPAGSRVVRWPRAMPQYRVGHLDRVADIERALEGTPGLFVTGAALRGVGIADCIHQANQLAERVGAYLHGLPNRPEGSANDDLTMGRR